MQRNFYSNKDFKAIIEELEDMEDVRLYDKAKKDDDGERILFYKYVKNRESSIPIDEAFKMIEIKCAQNNQH